MSITAISGMNTTANVLQDRRPVDMSNVLAWIEPSEPTPTTAIRNFDMARL